MLDASLARSRARIAAAGVVDPAHVDRVARLVERRRPGHDAVAPLAFLDDTTTKNVIVHDGRLSGIVDVDVVCYGDALLPVALTKMALHARGWETDYVEAWLAALDHAPGQAALLRLDRDVATFCIDLLAELGQRLNRDEPRPVDPTYVARLLQILDESVLASKTNMTCHMWHMAE